MTSASGSERRPPTSAGQVDQDSSHLDEDPEALEDPVHCGDAKHQHDLHQHESHQQVQPGPTPEPAQRD